MTVLSLQRKQNLKYGTKLPKTLSSLRVGFGMRMVLINLSMPRDLLEVNGERLIDRQVKQLHGIGIADITVVIGFHEGFF